MTSKGLLLRLLAVAMSLAVVVAAGELALRLLPPGRELVDTAVTATSRNRARHHPDFRDRSRPGPKAAGRFRVLALGDSFVWGAGVHPGDTYPRRLERRLATLDSAVEFEVVSWSRAGWNTRLAWKSVRNRLAALAPDLVLLGFTLNDPEPTRRQERERLEEPLPRRQPAAAWSRVLHRRSALYRLFWERFESRRQRRAFIAYYDALFTGPHWRDCRQALRELRDATRTLGVPLLMVVLPVFDSQLDRAYSYRRLHGEIAAAAGELEIPVLDLLPAFRHVDARRLAVTPFTDPHPSELAHRIAADELLDYLVAERLVPAAHPQGRRRVMAGGR